VGADATSARAILVIDAGTSALRAVRVEANGATTCLARETWRCLTPDDAAPFGRELDAGDVRGALARVMEHACGGGIAGVAFTGQREGLVLADDAGEAVLVSPNIDARAAAEGLALDAELGDEIYRATGHLPSLLHMAAKLAWLRGQRPRAAERVRQALPFADWLASTLTGETAASRSLLIENGMLDVGSGARIGAPLGGAWAGLVPRAVSEGTIAGRTGGMPVALCGGDTQCALVGMGAIAPGDAGVAAGWSAPVQVVTSQPTFDEAKRTWTGAHVVADRWVVESNAGELGRAWRWLRELLGVSEAEADALAAAAPAGARDVMTVLGPARMNAAAMNASVGGVTFPLPIVMSAPERGDLLRSMLETAAYAVRANLEQAEAVAGGRAPELRLGGGMSRSAIFGEVVANVAGRAVRVAPTPETSALGAAMLAAPSLGMHASLVTAAEAMTGGGRLIEPATRVAAQYADLYERWLGMCESMGALG